MDISLKGVDKKTLVSTLSLDKSSEERYKEFLEALEYHKQQDAVEAPLSSGRKHELGRMFRLIVSNYLPNIGLEIARWSNRLDERIYLRTGDPDKVLITCKGLSLVSPEDSDNFVPELEFLIQPELQVVSYIEREGLWKLDFLGDCLLVNYLSNANGINRPILRRGEKDEQLLVASIEQIPIVLHDLEEMYGIVGEDGLEQLASIYNSLRQEMPDKWRNETKDQYRLTLLEVMGIKGLLIDRYKQK